jgi:excisionase family DNA binding protein
MPAEMSLFAATSETVATTRPATRPAPTQAPPPVQNDAPPGEPATPERPTPPLESASRPTPTASIDIEDGKLLLTEREAAKALSVCPRTLWQLRTDGQIPCIRFGRAVRYDPADLRAWVARNRR